MMDFKRYFIYQADYQHWANDMLFNALDRLDESARAASGALPFGSIHDNVDHLAFFYRKWLSRLQGAPFAERYTAPRHPDWLAAKNTLRHELRTLQHWLENQPDEFFDTQISFLRPLNHEENGVWVRDALTHIFTYGATERGRISAAASSMGAPLPDMDYFTYRAEMGEHLEHLRQSDQ